ncbi:hypothetical protein ACI7YT_04805 [Microbacterium sp. M]|uniref:hypothetical protein n=1 Tax=Microbacterium sp. M TaxID=3377125 RepID=UPI003869FAAA
MPVDEKSRVRWRDLPAALRAEAARVLGGRVISAVSQHDGFSPGSADRIVTADGARAFVKAVRQAHDATCFDLHRREIAVMRVIPDGVRAPRLLGTYEREGWVALIIEDIDGEHPGTQNDGSQIESILDALATLPEIAADAFEALPRAADEFVGERDSWRHLESEGIELPAWASASSPRLRAAAERVCDVVDGAHLQHLDCRADNVLVDGAGAAWIIDWPWAGVGARWIDGLMYLFDARLRGERFDAEQVLATQEVFAGVGPDDIDSVLAGLTGRYFQKASWPAPAGMPTLRAFQYSEALAGADWLRERWG